MVQTALSLLALLCCAIGGINCVRRLAFEKPLPPGLGPSKRDKITILGLAALITLAYQAVVLFAALLEFLGVGAEGALNSFLSRNIDARHYRDLAQWGYGTGEGFHEQELMIVFFPLWPLLWKLGALNGGLPWYTAGMLLQLPLVCLAALMLYELLWRDYGRENANWALAYLAVSPAAVFCAVPMTESLFLLLTAGFFLALQREKPVAAAASGLLAAITRSPGALLSGAALIYILQRRKKTGVGEWLAVLSPAAGLGIYLGLNKLVYGSWTQFSHVQSSHWNQGLGFFPETVRYELDYCLAYLQKGDWKMGLFLFGAAALTIVIAFALLALASRKLRVHHLAYALAYCVFTMGATWLLSAPRYAMALFFLPLSLSFTARSTQARWGIFIILFLCGMAYTLAFLLHWSVY